MNESQDDYFGANLKTRLMKRMNVLIIFPTYFMRIFTRFRLDSSSSTA